MSRPINEDAPLDGVVHSVIKPCARECGHCADCVRYTRAINPPKASPQIPELSIKSRAEFYQVALREEGEAQGALLKAEAALATAQEACRDASAQLILTRDGLFKACGL